MAYMGIQWEPVSKQFEIERYSQFVNDRVGFCLSWHVAAIQHRLTLFRFARNGFIVEYLESG